MYEHLLSLTRRHPSRLPLASIGFIAEKRDWLDRVFDTYAFSFILQGSGEYTVGGRTWPVHAPCVLTQRPGEHFRYGPHQTWEEVFLVYASPCGDELKRLGFIAPARPIWYLGDPGPVLAALAELRTQLEHPDGRGVVDRIDRTAEHLVLASLLDAAAPETDAGLRAINAVRALLEDRFLEAHDIDHLAAEHGLSTATFRRLWNRQVGIPPQRYLMHLRLRRACRLLVETDESIAGIAQRLGFDDPLYFSRRFRALIGETASTHRARHQRAATRPAAPA